MSAAHYRLTLTRRVVVTVAVTVAVPRGISVHVDLGPCLSRPVGTRAGVCLLSRTTGTPAMPNIIPLRTVMDQDKETEGNREGTVQAAEDHVKEVIL